uniref:Chromosome 20 open reading frame 85 n=1 Tax=Chelydra serpentina TaxID=8475 RepID=A0A8C3RMG4_CHESE
IFASLYIMIQYRSDGNGIDITYLNAMTTHFLLIKDERKEPTKPKIELPEHLQIRPVTPVEKYIKVYPSPPIPKTTQGFIGWRSSVPGLELERYYQVRSCKGAFHKDLKWPDEPSD